MGRKLNLVGQRFGKLTVVKAIQNINNKTAWLCECDCGNTKEVLTMHLRKGDTTSCGCARSDWQIQHGMTKTRFYQIWVNMKRRCLNQNDKDYPNYGGRGIAVCEEWLKFENFFNDMYTSYEAHSLKNTEKNTTLERIDSNLNYAPENCTWTTRVGQARSTRKASRKFKAISPKGDIFYGSNQREFAEKHNLTSDYINKKLNNRKVSTGKRPSWKFEFIDEV